VPVVAVEEDDPPHAPRPITMAAANTVARTFLFILFPPEKYL
jgi:hypothetical protein